MSSKMTPLEAGLIGAGVGIALMFRPVRIVVCLLIAAVCLTIGYDKLISQTTLPQTEWSFQIDNPVADDMGGQVPTDISPRFKLTWTFENNSKMFIQSMRINGELYRCDTIGQPIESCDYLGRRDIKTPLNLPAGRHRTTNDVFTFYNGTSVPGILRARFWATDVIGDRDREY